MKDVPPTPPETVIQARQWALEAGLTYVYTGNIQDPTGQNTYCPHCGHAVIERRGYQISAWHVAQGVCGHCHHPIVGRFDQSPGDWGPRRQPVQLAHWR